MARRKLNQHLGRLVEDLDSGKVNPEVLSSRLREQIIFFIKRIDSTRPDSHIAKIVGLSNSQVGRIFRSGLRKMTPDVTGEIQDLVNLIWMKSNEYQRREIAAGRAFRAWGIFKETIEKLQSLGFVFEAPKKVMLANINANAGPSPVEVEAVFRRYFDEHGSVSLAELAAALGNGNGNGNGNGGGKTIAARLAPHAEPVPVAPDTCEVSPGSIPDRREERVPGIQEDDESKD
jgi:hypothetical protein